MSSSNFCLLTCIQISLEGCQMVWYSHVFQNFPQFLAIHTVKGFGIINKAEMFFWNSLAFSMIKQKLTIWSLVPLPFLNPVWTSGSSWFMYCWSLTWRILTITLLSWNECSFAGVWTFFGIAFLWDYNENWPFPSCDHCWVFQICWHIECSTFTASSFRIWNSSTGNPSPPLALFVVMPAKARLTSLYRMAGSRWVITPSWLSGREEPFIQFCVFLPPLFNIFCFC